MSLGVRRRWAWSLGAVAICLGLVVGWAPPGPARAALSGLTAFVIDGDTAGPDDWDDLPQNLLENQQVGDVCGNGVLDPDQLDGKLADLDLDAPETTPGNVVGKGDLCTVWRAQEAVPNAAGGYDVVLYGAWSRFSGNGEVTLYWPLLGPAPGKMDDLLIAFDFDASGPGTLGVLRWGGSDWVSSGTLPPGTVDLALDDPDRPLFGEFAVNLTGAGLWDGAADCTAYTSDFVFTRTGNSASAELQDYAGFAPAPISQCGGLVVQKVTTPAAPDPAQDFGYLLTRDGGGDVVAGVPSVTGSLTVPGAEEDTHSDVVAGHDYVLTEPNPPPGWSLRSIACTALDPASGETSTVDVTAGGTFPVAPGHTTECTVANLGPATLTIEKATIPEADTQEFGFTADRPGGDPVAPFSLSDGASHPIPVGSGDVVTVTEVVPAGWELSAVDCRGDDEAAADLGAATATVRVDAGEQIVCTFVNASAPATRAALVIEKTVPAPDGTGFDLTVTGPSADPSAFTLAPPRPARRVVHVTPEAGGSTYAVRETVPEGWDLVGARCRSRTGPVPISPLPDGLSLTVSPGQVVYCRLANEPVPPPARLTIVKSTTPSGGTGFGFATRGLDPAAFTLADGQSRVFDDLAAGRYRVTEAVPPGWAVSGSCSDGTRLEGGRVTLALEAGDDVVCTFQNVRQVSLTVTKQATPASAQDFAFAVALNRAAPVRVVLDDDGDEVDDPDAGRLVSSITGPALPPGLYTITESATVGWRLTALGCSGGQVVEQDATTGTATIRLTPGQSAECVFENERGPTPSPTTAPAPTTTAPTPSPPATATTGPPAPSATPVTPLEPAQEPGGDLRSTGASGVRATVLAGLALVGLGLVLVVAVRRRSS
jgi:hypothetical protein